MCVLTIVFRVFLGLLFLRGVPRRLHRAPRRGGPVPRPDRLQGRPQDQVRNRHQGRALLSGRLAPAGQLRRLVQRKIRLRQARYSQPCRILLQCSCRLPINHILHLPCVRLSCFTTQCSLIGGVFLRVSAKKLGACRKMWARFFCSLTGNYRPVFDSQSTAHFLPVAMRTFFAFVEKTRVSRLLSIFHGISVWTRRRVRSRAHKLKLPHGGSAKEIVCRSTAQKLSYSPTPFLANFKATQMGLEAFLHSESKIALRRRHAVHA